MRRINSFGEGFEGERESEISLCLRMPLLRCSFLNGANPPPPHLFSTNKFTEPINANKYTFFAFLPTFLFFSPLLSLLSSLLLAPPSPPPPPFSEIAVFYSMITAYEEEFHLVFDGEISWQIEKDKNDLLKLKIENKLTYDNYICQH